MTTPTQEQVTAMAGVMGSQPEQPKPEAPKQEPKEQKQPEPEPQRTEENREEKVDWKQKYEKAQASMQKRFDQQTARLHKLEAALADKDNTKSEKEEDNRVIEDLAYERRQYVDELKKVKRDLRLVDPQDEPKQFDDLVAKESELTIRLKRLDDRYSKHVDNLENKKITVENEKRLQTWGDKWQQLMEEFPEDLVDSKGMLDKQSPLFQEAIRLMEINARPSKWARFAPRINAKYDNPSGPLLAVYEAARRLQQPVSRGKTESYERADNTRNLRSQALTGGTNSHVSQKGFVSDSKIDKLIENVGEVRMNRGNMRTTAMEALKAIKEKHGIRSFK